MLNRIVKTVADHNLNLYSIAVMDGEGLRECRHRRADLCTNSYSVAKVFTMTAIGMLHDAGRLRVQDRVIDIFRDELPDGMDERWGEATVEHLLTHRVGLPQGFLDIDVDDLTRYKVTVDRIHTRAELDQTLCLFFFHICTAKVLYSSYDRLFRDKQIEGETESDNAVHKNSDNVSDNHSTLAQDRVAHITLEELLNKRLAVCLTK
jgi:hypothetical protein